MAVLGLEAKPPLVMKCSYALRNPLGTYFSSGAGVESSVMHVLAIHLFCHLAIPMMYQVLRRELMLKPSLCSWGNGPMWRQKGFTCSSLKWKRLLGRRVCLSLVTSGGGMRNSRREGPGT